MTKQDIPDRVLIQLRNHLINEAEEYEGDYPCRFNFEYVYDNDDDSSWGFFGECKAIVEDTKNGLEFIEFDYVIVDKCIFSDEWGEETEVEFDDVRFANPNPSVMLQVAEEQMQAMKKFFSYDPIEELDSLIASTKIAS